MYFNGHFWHGHAVPVRFFENATGTYARVEDVEAFMLKLAQDEPPRSKNRLEKAAQNLLNASKVRRIKQ